ncbi:MAG: YeeE/YedE family protein [Methylovulum sp.]|nr:YeeE/YedE family protein [Methylovulum sp.]
MAKNISAFVFGLIFGLGLIIAQMTNPAKVLAFLDIAGTWDPSLALVMASALLTLGVLQRVFRPLSEPDQEQEQPACGNRKSGIDVQLIGGAAIFGIGWGLSGICPGPALVGLTTGLPGIYVFAGAMFVGFVLFNFLHRR